MRPFPVSSWLASQLFPPAHPWLCSYSAGCALSALGPGALRGEGSLALASAITSSGCARSPSRRG
ncbi:protein of unknown function [Streptantibioticus cattleyicolor NRRL 8057 = DSM 46488]|nr:protein of unknown function [Streptantibioticus cattleyicolor NRRL 8057 = DSM 46488]